MRRPLLCSFVGLVAAVVGPRLVGPHDRSAGAPFVYEPPDGFVQANDAASDKEGARVWVQAASTESTLLGRRGFATPRVVLTHSNKEMSVEEAELARLAEEMPKAFEGLCTWVHRRHEMRVRADGARVGLVEGDCDHEADADAVWSGAAAVKSRKMQLMFPDDTGTWIATASYPTEEATRWEPLFEATIGKARGVAVRVPAPPIWIRIVWAAAGAVLAWLATALFMRGARSDERRAA